MTIDEARAEFEACWARFTAPELGSAWRGEAPTRDDLKALERAVAGLLSAAWNTDQLEAALAETAEAREIVRYGKLDPAISVVKSG